MTSSVTPVFRVTAYIGLGSNLGDKLGTINSAFEALNLLEQSELLARSTYYLTESFPKGNPDYINAVAKIKTSLAPMDLLKALLEIENEHGRVREEKWASRTLDLDLLLYGDEVINENNLIVPHPHMYKRATVLYPLADVAADLVLPDGVELKALLRQVPRDGIHEMEESLCQT